MRDILSILAIFVLGVFAASKKGLPSIEETEFGSTPANLFYFDDSDVVLVTDPSAKTTYRSDDAGVTWRPLSGVDKGQVLEVQKHPYDNQVAVVLGFSKKHWITRDQGKTWQSFPIPKPPTLMRPAISFHATDPDRIMVLTASCSGFSCDEAVYYTTDGFKTKAKLLIEDAPACLWAKTTDLFTTGEKDLDNDQILCIVQGKFSPFSADLRLLSSSDFFATDGVEPAMNAGRTVSGVTNLAAVKSYLVAAAKSAGTTELAMYVSDNAMTWHRAEFGEHKLEEDAYTLLESTNYSMQVDVLSTKPISPMGTLLTSNSNGTFFTKNVEHTNRNMHGYVDFEKIQNIQGIVMVNTVDNWEEVEKKFMAEKEIWTLISFDDGRLWLPMKAGDDRLHLHSVTDQANSGRIFSSPAPGIVMGVGNTGKHLGTYDEGDTYVSDDAGLTWTRALKGPHLYEFGDQGALIVAIEDEETDEIKYSLDHGRNFVTIALKDLGIKDKIRPLALTTTPDSTSLKFIITATKGKGSKLKHYIYSFDFDGLHEGKCKSKDFEDWYARVDSKGEPTCIMGHTQMFRRRKATSECFVDEEFKDPKPVMEDCKCTKLDFECDYEHGFTLDFDAQRCVTQGLVKIPDGLCKDGDEKYMGSSGYRLIPGNTCVRKGGEELDKPVERDCDAKGGVKPPSGKVESEITIFKGDKFMEYYYLERSGSSTGEDETIIMRTDRREAWLTRDHGKVWRQIVEDDEVVAIYPHQYLNDAVYLVTPSKTVYYSQDRGKNFHTFDAPEKPNQDRLQILQFHPTEKDWLIWTGSKDSQNLAHVSKKGGDDWETLLRGVRKCQFVYREDRAGSEQLVYCEQYENQDPGSSISLLSSDDFFEHKKELKRDVINFATMAEYIVVAVRDEDKKSLRVDTSIDGLSFADAQFPSNFKVEHQQAYTVLDSSTHAVFLHVTVNGRAEQEYGSIVKSNSNGTSYVLSVGEVNRNGPGYVDFEKMQGLEGVAIINRVANVKETDGGSAKKLKTYITHNDGADWALIQRPVDPPAKGAPKFECQGTNDGCSLHLHGYTERKDPRDTFSSPSAVGLMIGVGNVGAQLGYKKDADTFATRDGGITWTMVALGSWMWEFGDQGSILVMVKENVPTREVMVSLNEGIDWQLETFSDEDEMLVDDITTVPSDTSRNFLLWGRIKGRLASVNLDFSGLKERSTPCVLDEAHPEAKNSDNYLWSPKHPLSSSDCLFGHIAQYHRKQLTAECYNGRELQHLHSIASNCSCTRRDFECDYNYERQPDGSCALVEGLLPPDPAAVCKNQKSVVEYFDVTGYRRIPLTTCEGGQELDYTARTRPCPGREKEFEARHGVGGWGLFFAIIIPVGAAAGCGYYVWSNWASKFGRIQLGGDAGGFGGGANGVFDAEAPWVKYPVVVLSAVVAVVGALPMVVGKVGGALCRWWGWGGGGGYSGGGGGRGPFTTRDSFARGRGDYAIVDPDEGELLGEESEEEGV